MKTLIVGAGPTGLTAAIELARAGQDVIIIDKKPQGSNLSRAIGITPHSLAILNESGVTEILLAKGIKYKYATFYNVNKIWAKLNLNAAKPIQYGYNFILGLPQDQTENILREKLQELGVQVNYDCELRSISESKNTIIATTNTGKEIVADYILGADGVYSTTRHLVNIDFTGIKLTNEWSIADLETSDFNNIQDSVGLYTLGRGKVVFVAPISKQRFRLVSNTSNAVQSLPFKLNITKLYREGKFNIKVAQAQTYQKDRVFLAGDAAHCHSPVGGRGMNLGIADAADFAKKLQANKLEDYTKARYQEGKKIIQGSEVIRKIITSPNPIIHFFALAAVKCIFNIPYLERKFASNFIYG